MSTTKQKQKTETLNTKKKNEPQSDLGVSHSSFVSLTQKYGLSESMCHSLKVNKLLMIAVRVLRQILRLQWHA